jgi:RNA polymerase sigma factor (sigma-70 family)
VDGRPAETKLGRKLGPREQALVTSVLPLVDALALRVHRRFPDLASADLRSVGYEAAVAAVAGFDERSGASFSTFAYKRILGVMLREAPRELAGGLHERIRRAFAASRAEPPGELSIEEALVDTPEAARARAVAWVRRQAAGMLVAALYDATERTTDAERDFVRREEQVVAKAALDRALAALSDDERYFVERHYRDGATFDVLAKELGVVTRTVVRLHDGVKTKLAKALRREGVEHEPPIGEEEEEEE